jgi:hypothetical protein
MKYKTPDELRAAIWSALGLDKRSTLFHVIDVGLGYDTYGRGIIDTHDDLYNSDAFFDIEYDNALEPEIEVYGVDSYLLGDGEAEADSDDAAALQAFALESPEAMSALLRRDAELLVSLSGETMPNQCYEPDDE